MKRQSLVSFRFAWLGLALAVVVGVTDPVAAQRSPTPTPFKIDEEGFVPSGWMGDGEIKDQKFLQFALSTEQPHSGPDCWKLEYRPSTTGRPASVGWAAIAWQFPANNWGDLAGMNLKAKGYRQVSFWARAVPTASGALPELQAKAGNATAPGKKYQASFSADSPFKRLTANWVQYSIDISGKDLSNVVSAFTLVVRAPATIYIDDIEYR